MQNASSALLASLRVMRAEQKFLATAAVGLSEFPSPPPVLSKSATMAAKFQGSKHINTLATATAAAATAEAYF